VFLQQNWASLILVTSINWIPEHPGILLRHSLSGLWISFFLMMGIIESQVDSSI